jgi:predicted nucleotidyltransferase component of viral defense system
LNKEYKDQTQQVINILPLIEHKDFALKGGTAINLFFRNLPRLSVDIDLAYLPLKDRETTFKNIHLYLQNISNALTKKGFICNSNKPLDGISEAKLLVKRNKIQIKIEPNFTLRGTVFPPSSVALSDIVKQEFGASFKFNCLSFEDLFGGKICAALIRQHPRDLFDVMGLLNNEGLTKKLKDAFIFYLVSSPKPFFEVLNPHKKQVDEIYRDKFSGMTTQKVLLRELDETFHDLVKIIKQNFTESDIEFLISLLELKPKWDLIFVKNLYDYPSIKWRMLNITKMDPFKRTVEIRKLQEYWRA